MFKNQITPFSLAILALLTGSLTTGCVERESFDWSAFQHESPASVQATEDQIAKGDSAPKMTQMPAPASTAFGSGSIPMAMPVGGGGFGSGSIPGGSFPAMPAGGFGSGSVPMNSLPGPGSFGSGAIPMTIPPSGFGTGS